MSRSKKVAAVLVVLDECGAFQKNGKRLACCPFSLKDLPWHLKFLLLWTEEASPPHY